MQGLGTWPLETSWVWIFALGSRAGCLTSVPPVPPYISVIPQMRVIVLDPLRIEPIHKVLRKVPDSYKHSASDGCYCWEWGHRALWNPHPSHCAALPSLPGFSLARGPWHSITSQLEDRSNLLNQLTEPTHVNVAGGEGGRKASSHKHLKSDFVEMILLTVSGKVLWCPLGPLLMVVQSVHSR